MIKYTITKYFLKICSCCSWLLSYITLSLLIGEFHPFSKAEMYNSFPEKAYIVAVTDSKGGPLPVNAYFIYSTSDLTHNYHAVKQKVILSSDTNKYFDEIGNVLNRQLMPYQHKLVSSYEIRLFSVSYKNHILNINSKKLYESVK